MKYSKLLFLPFLALLACSKHDSTPALQNTKVTTTPVTAPSGLTTAAETDSHASFALADIEMANSLTAYTSMFAIPTTGANKQSSPIVASNGRVSSSTVTYIWNDTQSGNSVGYQVTDEGTSYKWEYFIKLSGTTTWLKYLNAEETKDGSVGSLKIYDFLGDNPSLIEYEYSWTKVQNQFTFNWDDTYSSGILTINLSTKAGNAKEFSGVGANAVLEYKYEWGTDGHGSWTSYDSDGVTVIDSGTW
jgi:hypothetical protein